MGQKSFLYEYFSKEKIYYININIDKNVSYTTLILIGITFFTFLVLTDKQ